LQSVFAETSNPYITAAWVTGVIVMAVTITAAYFTEETFGKDLNYTEQ
jgi:MFS transporter, putative metabolite:H+ symporter